MGIAYVYFLVCGCVKIVYTDRSWGVGAFCVNRPDNTMTNEEIEDEVENFEDMVDIFLLPVFAGLHNN